MGKSRFLAEATRAAAARNMQVVHGAADEVLQSAPLAPFFAALGRLPAAPAVREGAEASDPRLQMIERVRSRLEERVARAPTLVVLDNLHWADTVTLLALRFLPYQLAGYPVVWMLARRSGAGEPAVDRLYGLLEQTAGAVRVELGPLPEEAAAELAGDLLGALPGPDVDSLVRMVDGNPLLLVELVQGLVEEGGVRIHDGTARLVSPALTGQFGASSPAVGPAAAPSCLPQRFRRSIDRRLESLAPQTRRLLEIAAILGPSFAPDDVAAMMVQPTGALLPALREALDARILVCADENLAFRHDVVWRTILQTMPVAVRRALHREAADLLRTRGRCPATVASHLVHGARQGDRGAVQMLGAAAEESLGSCPRTAAELALRGVEVSEASDPARVPLTVTAVKALTLGGPLRSAIALARDELNQTGEDGPGLPLRYWLATALLLTGATADAVTAAQKTLRDPDLPADLVDDVELLELLGLSVLDGEAAEGRATTILAQPEPATRNSLVGALTVLARTRWDEGRLADGLRLARDAVSRTEEGWPVAWYSHPRLTLAAMLAALDEYAETGAALDRVQEELRRLGAQVLAGVPRLLRARVELAAGRSDTAVTEASAGLALAEETGVSWHASTGWAVLATVALRRGDDAAAAEHVRRLHEAVAAEHGDAPSARHLWVTAQLAAAVGDDRELRNAVAAVAGAPDVCRRSLLEEPTAAAWFVRTMAAAGLDEEAGTVLATIERLAADNPGIPALGAAALHAGGVHRRDPQLLERAVEEHRDVWASGSAAEDLGRVLAATDRDRAVRSLDHALSVYGSMGAERDAARVRRQLRHLGVRRRHWTYTRRPTTGWDSLTETEQAVARLVAKGLTNRQVAGQMFLSPHTVGFHLRQIFRKLDIRSRVELVGTVQAAE
nr:RebR-like transcriptional regulator [uncultured bacterium]